MSASVVIAIQARSGSTRLPKKAYELISGARMLDRVLESCKRAAAYINRPPIAAQSRVVVLCPYGDSIVKDFGRHVTVIEGSEFDVLSRYATLLKAMPSNYIVRITGDCPLIPPFIISKHVDLAITNGYDYVSNVDERWRTSLDGIDCEVMSSKMLAWVNDIATTPYDREHVTTMIRKSPPEWAKIGFVANFFDMSPIKYSVDTADDLERVRKAFEEAQRKYSQAVLQLGQTSVHRM